MKTEKRLLEDIIRINLQLSLRLLKLMIHLLLQKEHTGCIELPHLGELEAVLCDNYPAWPLLTDASQMWGIVFS